MVVPRVLFGHRAAMGDEGLFVSRPGVDVRTALPDDLLVSPEFKNLQFLHQGFVYCPYNTWTPSYFPIACVSPPLVLFSVMSDLGSYSLPSMSWHTHALSYGSRAYVASYTDRIEVFNGASPAGGATPFWLRFFVTGNSSG